MPKDVLAQGFSAAFNSDKTPAFGQMVANLFQQSNSEQKTGMLNQLLAAAGPEVFARVLGTKGSTTLVSTNRRSDA